MVFQDISDPGSVKHFVPLYVISTSRTTVQSTTDETPHSNQKLGRDNEENRAKYYCQLSFKYGSQNLP